MQIPIGITIVAALSGGIATAVADEYADWSAALLLQQPLAEATLAEVRGTGGVDVEYLQLSNSESYAQLQNNSAQSTISGDNMIGPDVFASAQGFATVIQNSGNNVIIQNSTIINFSME
ncbi:MAG: hypothetical protein AB1810_06090 [Pseudomonadota bacterium]